jgi:hypothetical protein
MFVAFLCSVPYIESWNTCSYILWAQCLSLIYKNIKPWTAWDLSGPSKQLNPCAGSVVQTRTQQCSGGGECCTSSWTIGTGFRYSAASLQQRPVNAGPSSTLPWGQENHKLVGVSLKCSPLLPTFAPASSIQQGVQPDLDDRQSMEPLDPVTPTPGNYPWQTVKRRRTHPSPSPTTIRQPPTFSSPNPFGKLLHLSEADRQAPASAPPAVTNSDQTTQPRIKKPPPIYMYGVTNYRDMVKYLAVTLEEE